MRASLLLFAFNQEATIRDAALACLGQVCEPIQIIFSDDCSSDATYAVMQSVASQYSGPHHLTLRRNPSNLGIGAHYNTVIKASVGELLITAAGDDISYPNRVAELLQAWDASGKKADLLTSYLVDMATDGQLYEVLEVDDLSRFKDLNTWLNQRPRVIGAAHAFTRRLHEQFGDFLDDLRFEDQVMSLRASLAGGGVTIPKPLLSYRRGGLSSKNATPNQIQSLRRRHENNLLMYEQLLADLIKVKQQAHWPLKFEWRRQRSAAFLNEMNAPLRVQMRIDRRWEKACFVIKALAHLEAKCKVRV